MTPFDHAKRIVTIACPGKQVLVVSLTNQAWRLALAVTSSAIHADQIALLARQIIAAEVVEALKNEGCRLASEIDQRVLSGQMMFPQEASVLCRQLAELHTVELHSCDGQTDGFKPSGNSESAAPSGRIG
jgi:hypothetical protein